MESSQVKMSRPLSPHLGIYKPQITSILSILHRISGVALFVGLLILLWTMVYMAYSAEGLPPSWLLTLFGTSVGKGIGVLWSYALFFHFCTGIRHLFWDVGKGFDMSMVRKSGVFAVVSSIVLCITAWSIVFLV
jgi:succinate dehydrogenase / fumarate reductase cytochrome b subunit